MDIENFLLIFTSILYEALPFVVLGVVLAGLLEEFVPQQAITRVIPSNRSLAIVMGSLLGLVFPMCECGIIVVMRRLLRKGLPLSVCIAYMLAGPVINGVVIMSTYVAFNTPDPKMQLFGGPWNVVAIRLGFAFFIAVVTALIVEREYRKHGLTLLHPMVTRGLKQEAGDDNGQPRTWKDRIGSISTTALNDFVDIMAFLILGACLAGLGRLALQELDLEQRLASNAILSILLLMGAAVLFCLCSEADAFVAANFGMFWPPAAKMAFMVLGPMLDLKLYLMYTRVFRFRLIFTIIRSVVVLVFVLCLMLHYIASRFDEYRPVLDPTKNPAVSTPGETK